jgi:hypothetical protein
VVDEWCFFASSREDEPTEPFTNDARVPSVRVESRAARRAAGGRVALAPRRAEIVSPPNARSALPRVLSARARTS